MAVPLRPDATLARAGAAPVESSYREYRPGPAAPEAVACTWSGYPGWSRRLRVLPDGCLELVWDGEHARAVPPVPGPARYPVRAGAQSIGIRIQPGWGAIVLGVPLRQLADVTDLAELWDAMAVRHLEVALAAGPTAAARRRILSHAVACRLAVVGPPDPAVLGTVRLLSQPHALVGDAAWHAHLSDRQLRRRFADNVGLPPKALHAILRFQRLRRQLTSPLAAPVTLARAAAECGYFDQAHLCHACARRPRGIDRMFAPSLVSPRLRCGSGFRGECSPGPVCPTFEQPEAREFAHEIRFERPHVPVRRVEDHACRRLSVAAAALGADQPANGTLDHGPVLPVGFAELLRLLALGQVSQVGWQLGSGVSQHELEMPPALMAAMGLVAGRAGPGRAGRCSPSQSLVLAAA